MVDEFSLSQHSGKEVVMGKKHRGKKEKAGIEESENQELTWPKDRACSKDAQPLEGEKLKWAATDFICRGVPVWRRRG